MADEKIEIRAGVWVSVQALADLGYVKKKPTGPWVPQLGEKYYFCRHPTAMGVNQTTWDNHPVDTAHFAREDVYETEALALAAEAALLALVRVKRKLEELTEEPLDWRDGTQQKWGIYRNHRYKEFRSSPLYYHQNGSSLYGSKSATDWVLNNMADDLVLIWGEL